jgi:hypothetical protein
VELAADVGVNGTAPETVRVRKEYSDECDTQVEGRAEVTPNSLLVVVSTEDGCSSSKRWMNRWIIRSRERSEVVRMRVCACASLTFCAGGKSLQLLYLSLWRWRSSYWQE